VAAETGPGVGAAAGPAGATAAVVAMCGLPFAGKSTLARAVAARTGARLVEVDALLAEDARAAGGPVPDAAWSAAYRRAEVIVREALAAGERVVYDGVNFRWVMRHRLRRVAATTGGEVLIVHVTTSGDVIAARRARNRVAPTRSDVDDATFDTVRARFQPPGPDEWTVTHDGTEPVEAWLDRHFG
jgi:predicted kinase